MAGNWPWIGELRVAQAMLATELGRDDQAIAILAELNEKIPDNAQIQNMLVQAYERALKKR
jgi:predicted Zn-dependent protease